MSRLKPVWDNASKFGRVVIVSAAVLIVLIIIGAATGGGGNNSGNSSSGAQNQATTADRYRRGEAGTTHQSSSTGNSNPQPPPQQQPRAPKQQEPSAEQRVREDLGDEVSSDFAVGNSEVRSVKVTGDLLDITLSTPEGGLEGPSTDDTDALTSAALATAYADAGWQGAAFVEFRGGLVDSATGRSLPNAPTVGYRIERHAAKQIDWSDEEALFNIDWGIYRGLCYPAIKGC